jgi:hypothetical protein
MNTGLVPPRSHRRLLPLMMLAALAAAVTSQGLLAATFTVVNSCSYTIYPGIYPATYSNGGWTMNPGTSVSFTLPSGWNGRIWGRRGCDNSNPAQCTTGQCGGNGLQCAGTTGQAGTSLAEFNLNANGTDFYNVSYVDGFDNPIGVKSSNSSCVSPNTCTTAPLNNCSSDLKVSSAECLSPCTRYNTDQYCCRGAYGTAQTCIVANWPASAQSYVNNIHNACPREYAYAYDENSGAALQTCPTGSNYTVTFCPNGNTANLNGSHTLTPQNATNSRLDDYAASTAAGNQIDIYAANGSGAQTWVLSNNNVSPAGYYNLAVSYGPHCMTAMGSAANSSVLLQPCDGSRGQAWNVVSKGNGNYTLQPATNTNLCLDVLNGSNADYTPVLVYTCTGANNQSWAIN